VQALFEKYGLTYTTGSLPRQVGSAWKKVFRLALPNEFGAKAQAKVLELANPANLVRRDSAGSDSAAA
jgi:linoleoyl-CoA desaturase